MAGRWAGLTLWGGGGWAGAAWKQPEPGPGCGTWPPPLHRPPRWSALPCPEPASVPLPAPPLSPHMAHSDHSTRRQSRDPLGVKPGLAWACPPLPPRGPWGCSLSWAGCGWVGDKRPLARGPPCRREGGRVEPPARSAMPAAACEMGPRSIPSPGREAALGPSASAHHAAHTIALGLRPARRLLRPPLTRRGLGGGQAPPALRLPREETAAPQALGPGPSPTRWGL